MNPFVNQRYINRKAMRDDKKDNPCPCQYCGYKRYLNESLKERISRRVNNAS